MRMETLQVKKPEAKNVVKVRVTATNKEDARKAAEVLAESGNWTNYQIKRIWPVKSPARKAPELITYYALLWNE